MPDPWLWFTESTWDDCSGPFGLGVDVTQGTCDVDIGLNPATTGNTPIVNSGVDTTVANTLTVPPPVCLHVADTIPFTCTWIVGQVDVFFDETPKEEPASSGVYWQDLRIVDNTLTVGPNPDILGIEESDPVTFDVTFNIRV